MAFSKKFPPIVDSLDGYFCRHSIDYTNQYSLTPPTTPAYTTEDISASYTVVSYLDNVTMPTASDYTGYTAFIFYMTMAGFLLCKEIEKAKQAYQNFGKSKQEGCLLEAETDKRKIKKEILPDKVLDESH